MPGALPLLQRLGVDPDGMPLRGVTYTDGTRRVDHRFRTGPGRGVRRTTLHAALAARADELGVARVAGKVERVVQDDAGVTVSGDELAPVAATGCSPSTGCTRRSGGRSGSSAPVRASPPLRPAEALPRRSRGASSSRCTGRRAPRST